MSSNNLISGKNYTLANLFSGNRKIVIPDLQRDYCWGDENHGSDKKTELVSHFCQNLIDEFLKEKNEDNKLQLGMIYAYESPVNHIQLADGQQRITTLFLLLGMLYRKMTEENKDVKNILMSDFEFREDDREPRLQYAIRESTLYFLSDLVINYFFNKEKNNIKKTNWYFSEYDYDPSIQSMINAIKKIENKINKEKEMKPNDFANWLINNVEILYFDMEDRSRGEKMFVVINTTGEPLSATENLKPLLIGDLENSNQYSEEWEERETYFWRNRNENENEADFGMNDFLTWFVRIKKTTENVNLHEYFLKEISNKEEILKEVHRYFEILKILPDTLKNRKNVLNQFPKKESDRISDIRNWSQDQQHNILLPLLSFMNNVSDNEGDVYQFLRRLRKNYFDKEERERKGNYLDWRYVLRIIETCPEDVFSCKKIDGIHQVENNIKNWYNKEEELKSVLKKNNRFEIEEWEDHKDFQGDISPLFEVTNDSLDIEELKKHFESYNDFVNPKEELRDEINLLRICSDYKHKWFSVGGIYYNGIQKIDDYKIFNRKWFYQIWREYTRKYNGGKLRTLFEINKALLWHIITEGKMNYDDSGNIDLKLNSMHRIALKEIQEFENKRIESWWGDGISTISFIYYWMYLEKNNGGRFLDKKNYNQIGFRIKNEDVEEYSLSNITIGLHYPYGTHIGYYSLMKKVSNIQIDKNLKEVEKIQKVENLLQQLKDKIIS